MIDPIVAAIMHLNLHHSDACATARIGAAHGIVEWRDAIGGKVATVVRRCEDS